MDTNILQLIMRSLEVVEKTVTEKYEYKKHHDDTIKDIQIDKNETVKVIVKEVLSFAGPLVVAGAFWIKSKTANGINTSDMNNSDE